MRKRWGLVGKASMVALLTAVLAPSIGQWPSYPTAGVPRTRTESRTGSAGAANG
jgi:hypothetical protein